VGTIRGVTQFWESTMRTIGTLRAFLIWIYPSIVPAGQ